MSEAEPMKDIRTYCPHKDLVDGFCKKCSIYLCKNCQVKDHFDHISDIQGLDSIITDAVKEYAKMNSALDKHLLSSSNNIKDGAIDETLLQVEKHISEEYDKLLKDVKSVEEEQVRMIRGAPLFARLQKDKTALEGEDLKALEAFDHKLGTTIAQLLGALESEKFEAVAPLLDEGAKEKLQKEAQQFEPYYAKQKNFMKQLETIRSIKPKVAYDAKTIEDLVQVKGVHEEPVKLFLFDNKTNAVYAYHPKVKTVKKNEVKGTAIPTKHAQVALEEDTLFICGGKKRAGTYFASSYIYSETDNKFAAKAPMTQERAYHAIANRKDAEIYVAGGENATGLLDTAEVYDVKANAWKTLPSLTEPKKNVVLCLCSDKYLYAVGGHGKDGEVDTIEVLNVADIKAWERKTVKGAVAAEKLGAVQVADNQILIFGGKVAGKRSTAAMLYDIANGTAMPKSALKAADNFNRSDTRKFDGMLYATGNKKVRTHVYDPESDQWSIISEKDYTLKYNWD